MRTAALRAAPGRRRPGRAGQPAPEPAPDPIRGPPLRRGRGRPREDGPDRRGGRRPLRRGRAGRGPAAGRPDPTRRKLAAPVTRLRQLTALRVAQANQRRLAGEPEALASIDAVLALVGRQARELEGKIAALVGDDPAWKALDAAFRQIKGVAGRTVARLLAEMPEVGTLSGKAAAKLAGLAPIARDGGKRAGRRPVRGGREGVRSILVVVAGVVRRHDPDFRASHRKLTEAGKPAMVVRVALTRKLLVRFNAKARDARGELAKAAAP
jgi:transposase